MSIPDEISVAWAADSEPDPEEHLYPGSCRCGARWFGEAICHCATCHLTFTSIGPFDAHRVGPIGKPRRRCWTEAELRDKGYEPNSHGHWRRPRPAGSIPGFDLTGS